MVANNEQQHTSERGKGDVEEELEEGWGTGKGPCVSIRVLVCMGDQAAGLDDHNGG